ncbi:MAG TPA: DUF3575 domain-containing protein [Saprospiraceae bacterium]|nr:DUF3575 domain-containing protein [Saprospiraceae bacterium]
MKNVLSLFVLFLLFTNIATSQSAVVKTSPIGLAFGNFNVTYEKVLNSSSSALVSANYIYKLFGIKVGTFGLGAGYRYYITHAKKDVPKGFYIQPQVGFSIGNADDFKYNSISFGAEIGYQWVWTSGFSLDLGIGPSYTNYGGDFDSIGFDGGSGILPTGTLAIGFAF